MPDELTWVPRAGVLVAVQTEPPPPPPLVDVHQLIACPTCRARVDETCKSATGHRTTPHASRLAPRLCPCGASLAPRRRLCDPCAAKALRVSKRDYLRRRRAAQRAQKAAA